MAHLSSNTVRALSNWVSMKREAVVVLHENVQWSEVERIADQPSRKARPIFGRLTDRPDSRRATLAFADPLDAVN